MTRQPEWRSQLLAKGATFDRDRVLHFGEPDAELTQATSGAACAPLTDFCSLRVSGRDAGTFLQSQITSDMRQVSESRAQLGGYCTPKGRLFATFLGWVADGDYLLMVPAGLAGPVTTRLRRYVLRSRVQVDLDPALALIGLLGPLAGDTLKATLGACPGRVLAVVRSGPVTTIQLPGETFVLAAPQTDVVGLWDQLAASARAAGVPAWEWGQIHAGTAWITAGTQELFLPQMVALDAIGGVSFDKGCYPGQEIVARTHYLGSLKRQLYLAHLESRVQPGDELSESGTTEPAGTVVNAAPAPRGGWDALVVLRGDPLERTFRLAGSGIPVTVVKRAGTAEAAEET
ncbi:MAG TPA: folate-binding protein [Burkholderiales bacterium]|nr:folate-binding protein [Burkholderiales bacterium]